MGSDPQTDIPSDSTSDGPTLATASAEAYGALLISTSTTIDAALLTGTVNSARLTGAYTGITGLGTIAGTLTAGTFSGALSGNATTATTLATARNINGVSFNGSADITVPAAAGTLTGTTLASGVTASSLTSVGTLTGLTVSGGGTFGGNVSIPGNGSGNVALLLRGPSDLSYRVDAITNQAAMPFTDGPRLVGYTGWSFFSVEANSYRMGFRANGGARYLWNNDFTILGSAPNDAIATHTLRINGNSYTSSTVESGGLIVSTLQTTATGTGSPWSVMGFRAESLAAGGTNSAGYVAHVPGYAPQMRVYQGSGEIWNFLNNPNTGYVPLWASAFTVQSTLRSKKDITTIEDGEILSRLAETPRVVRYRYKVGPQTLVPDERFADVDARWQASGHAPLTPQPHHFGSQAHDCVVMNCAGNADSPCPITVNSEPDVGVIAEEWDEVWPELVWVDEEGEIGGFDYTRLGPVAMRAAALLLSQVEELAARVAALETEA
jgi:hypothetical protein